MLYGSGEKQHLAGYPVYAASQIPPEIPRQRINDPAEAGLAQPHLLNKQLISMAL